MSENWERVGLVELKQRTTAGVEPFAVWVQVEKNQRKTARNGKPFLEWTLRDAEDTAGIKIWDNHPDFANVASLRAGTFIEISGYWTTNEFGLDVRDWILRTLDADERSELLAGSEAMRVRQEKDFADITRLVGSMNDPRLKGLSHRYLEQFGARFRRTAAARDYHHAWRGGLVEHTAQMMRSGDALAKAYPQLNRDLLLAGVLFHDCGKLWENSFPENGFIMPYQMRGEMLGHITIGIELVNKLWRELMESSPASEWRDMEPANEDVRLHLLHLVASHHGELAFGSPVLPKTPEAIVLHHIDNIDAKLEMFRRGYEQSQELAPGIVDKVRPLSQRLIRPLPRIDGADPASPHLEETASDTLPENADADVRALWIR